MHAFASPIPSMTALHGFAVDAIIISTVSVGNVAVALSADT
jgi:putative protein kinase ArgK-like GTPase of G3E family